MRVGIDIDGVLLNSQAMWLEAGKKFAKENNVNIYLDENKFMPAKIFGWTKEADLQFWKEYYEDYYVYGIPTKEAVKALRRLKDDGYELYFITARGAYPIDQETVGAEKLKDITMEWFDKNEIPYDKVIFTDSPSKSKLLLENNIEVMIDDNTVNIKEMSQVMPVINFARIYNEDVKNIENSNYKIFRTDDWNLIVTIIEYRLEKYL